MTYKEKRDELIKSISHYDRNTLNKLYAHLILDTCETDTFIREVAAPILGQDFIDGDSYYVPPVEDIVSSLVERIARVEELENENSKLRDALEPFAQIGDIVNDADCTLWKRVVAAGDVRKARDLIMNNSTKERMVF